MRIVLLTPGTGSFYCGTCMRDNALAIALRRQGHDALMVPMYLPPTLDEVSASEGAPLFYGGINVYLQQKIPLFRKTPRWVDQLFDSPAALQGAAKRAGMTRAAELGDLTLSMLKGEDGNQAKELDRLLEWLSGEGKADVVILSNALLMGLGRRIAATGAKVFCTLQGEDTFLDSLPEPDRTDSWQTLSDRAKEFDGFIAVSRYHADLMRERANLDPAKVHVVYNGISLDGYDAPAAPQNPPVLGYLARMYPPKGLGTLVDAYLQIRKNNRIPYLRLHICGAQTAGDISYVDELRGKLASAGFDGDVSFFPNVDRAEKIRFLQGLSVLSVPATYGESFGLYLLEALAAGVPVVQPRHAVFPELLGETGGGILYDPEAPDALATAIETLLCDPDHARALGMAGRTTVFDRFHVDAMAKNVAEILQ
ncbi:MAG: glycosyltransferase family 4 protein [Armatimonadaceae bacterium]